MRVGTEGVLELIASGAIRGITEGQLTGSGISICVGLEVLVERPKEPFTPPMPRMLLSGSWRDSFISVNAATGYQISPKAYIVLESSIGLALPMGYSAVFIPDQRLPLYGLQYVGSHFSGGAIDIVRLTLTNMSPIRAIDILPGIALGELVIDKDF